MGDILFTTVNENDLSLPFILYGLGMNHIQEPIQRLSGLPIYQWIQCIQGSGHVYIKDHAFIVKPGQGIFLLPDVAHSYLSFSSSEDWIVDFICFKGEGIAELFKDTQFKDSGVFLINEPDVITQKLKSLYNLKPVTPLLSLTSYSVNLYDLLLHLLLYAKTDQGTSLFVQNHRIAPVIAYIEANYNKPIFLDELSKLCYISQEYLCKLFKKTTGIRIFEYIQCTRIKRSKEMLLSMPDLPIHTIGTLCGFNSVSYYIKVYKKFEQLSPGEFRTQNGISS